MKKNEKGQKKMRIGTAESAITCALFHLPPTWPTSAAEESAQPGGLPPQIDILDWHKPLAYSMIEPL
jgi:hypothetical protein